LINLCLESSNLHIFPTQHDTITMYRG